MDRGDCCSAPAPIRWWHAETKREWRMCEHHSREHGPALTAQGYIACTPVALGPVTADGRTH